MRSKQQLVPSLTIGVDLGDRTSVVYAVRRDGTVAECKVIATTPAAIREYFQGLKPARVVLEAGTHSPWVSRVVDVLGHSVVVANPAELYGRRRRKRRNDALDAEFLARQGRADPALLHPIRHRSERAQADLEVLRARDVAVHRRSQLINHVRGVVKSYGGRLRACSAESFVRRTAEALPTELQPAVEPLFQLITDTNAQIRRFDQTIERLINERYPVARRLQQIVGVGPITALTFVLIIDDPTRFETSREVGAFFGLVPRLDDSGDMQPQLRITKAGDAFGRRLLVSSARYILGPFGPDCDLRRHGEAIAQRGGRNARKRAAVAVARKLAVVMHKLWVGECTYDPEYQVKKNA